MAELWPNYAMNYLQKYEELVLHGRIMADILAGGRIVAELLKPTGQNVLDRPRLRASHFYNTDGDLLERRADG
jgi:hypothetical protein